MATGKPDIKYRDICVRQHVPLCWDVHKETDSSFGIFRGEGNHYEDDECTATGRGCDCGLFAIEFATALENNIKPCRVVFIQTGCHETAPLPMPSDREDNNVSTTETSETL